MGKYQEIYGDLIFLAKQEEFDVIAHGANCFGTMGAGIALKIKNFFPEAFYADISHYNRWSAIHKLGNFTSHVYKDNNGKDKLIVYNLYSQYKPGPNLDYSALELSLRKLSMITDKNLKIGLPQIGCGIAGGDWEKVKEIIQRVLSEHDVTIVFYEPETGF